MKILYVTTYNAKEIIHWSGAGYYVAEALKRQGVELIFLGDLKIRNVFYQRFKRKLYQKLFNKKYRIERSPSVLKHYASQIEQAAKNKKIDAVFSPASTVIAEVKIDIPIVVFTDATFKSMIGFYDSFSNLAKSTLKWGEYFERKAIQRANALCYTSQWVIDSAIKHYGANPEKLYNTPFGAAIDHNISLNEMKQIIDSRSREVCHILLIATDWKRKGGETVLSVVKNLNAKGFKVELHIIGRLPKDKSVLPDFVTSYGFLNKQNNEQKDIYYDVCKKCHFLFVPSEAETFGMIFSDASAFAIPSISHNVGGISSAIHNGKNGMCFPENTSVDHYAEYIEKTFGDKNSYRQLAVSSFEDYQNRLNWDVIGKQFVEVLKKVI